MKRLNKNEWVAVTVSVFVVGFFLVFGNWFLSFFSNSNNNLTQNLPLMAQDVVMGLGEEVKLGDRVVVHYTGSFADGTIFDSSLYRNEPLQFTVGAGQVIQGWDQGVQGMKVGGVRVLSIPPELGYGFQDYGPIPAGSTLIFEIELLRVDR